LRKNVGVFWIQIAINYFFFYSYLLSFPTNLEQKEVDIIENFNSLPLNEIRVLCEFEIGLTKEIPQNKKINTIKDNFNLKTPILIKEKSDRIDCKYKSNNYSNSKLSEFTILF
jgi:hypothetical protein